MKKYRIRSYDLANDIYLLQVPWMFFFWRTVAAGSFDKMAEIANKLKA
jgi:hypothetical protein